MSREPHYGLVTVNGCFDGLHGGHLFYLGYAKAYGRRLIVGINDDAYIVAHKRPNPIPAEQRRQALLDLGFIDDVLIFSDPDPREFLGIVKPNAHCTSTEYPGAKCIERQYCLDHGIELIEIPRAGNWSSTAERGGKLPDQPIIAGRTLHRLANEVYLDISGGEVPYDWPYWDKYLRYAKTRLGEALTTWRKSYVEALVKVHGVGLRLLDFGCGTGDIVRLDENSPDARWFGYDVNEFSIAFLRDIKRLEARPVFATFGAVSFFDSLEHLPRVEELLRAFPSHTLLVASIPLWPNANWNDLPKLAEWRHWRPKEHFLYASPRGFAGWVQSLGFEVLDHNTMEIALGRQDIHTYALRKLQ